MKPSGQIWIGPNSDCIGSTEEIEATPNGCDNCLFEWWAERRGAHVYEAAGRFHRLGPRTVAETNKSPRWWNHAFDNQLKEMMFVQTTSNPCFYIASARRRDVYHHYLCQPQSAWPRTHSSWPNKTHRDEVPPHSRTSQQWDCGSEILPNWGYDSRHVYQRTTSRPIYEVTRDGCMNEWTFDIPSMQVRRSVGSSALLLNCLPPPN